MTAHEQLKAILQEDIRQLELLAEVLHQEKSVLSSADIQPLQEMTSRKNQILEGIRERAKKKIHLLVNMESLWYLVVCQPALMQQIHRASHPLN